LLLVTLVNEFGLAIRYGLQGPRFELRWREFFWTHPHSLRGPQPSSTNRQTKKKASKQTKS